jgi:hypothetical protein
VQYRERFATENAGTAVLNDASENEDAAACRRCVSNDLSHGWGLAGRLEAAAAVKVILV